MYVYTTCYKGRFEVCEQSIALFLMDLNSFLHLDIYSHNKLFSKYVYQCYR